MTEFFGFVFLNKPCFFDNNFFVFAKFATKACSVQKYAFVLAFMPDFKGKVSVRNDIFLNLE